MIVIKSDESDMVIDIVMAPRAVRVVSGSMEWRVELLVDREANMRNRITWESSDAIIPKDELEKWMFPVTMASLVIRCIHFRQQYSSNVAMQCTIS